MALGVFKLVKFRLPGRDLSWRAFFVQLYEAFRHDRVDDVAATVTYYAVLAMFPFLVFLVAVVSRVVRWETIEEIVGLVARVMPPQVTTIVSERLTALKVASTGSLLTVGFVAAIWSASAGVGALMPAFNRAYDLVESRPWWRRRLLSLGLTIGLGIFGVVASLVALVVPALGRWVGEPLATVLTLARLPVAGLIMSTVWAGLYKFLPNASPYRRVVFPGAFSGVLLWVLASWAFGQYVQHFGRYETTYGALGGVIVLLLWMWVSAMAMILGAEINNILDPHKSHDLDLKAQRTHH
ncbi:MAG: YihY/virulence factor BrkB family protein [Myxococcales bacterium]|nr:YihY/virulence factor BrkB family protein [Myxococcales bacterium]